MKYQSNISGWKVLNSLNLFMQKLSKQQKKSKSYQIFKDFSDRVYNILSALQEYEIDKILKKSKKEMLNVV